MKKVAIVNIIAIVSMWSVVLAAPTAVRTSPETITVSADYSFISQGEPFGVTTGVPILDSVAWEQGGVIEYAVLAGTEYTIHAFELDSNAPDGRIHSEIVVVAVEQSEPTLDDIMYNLVKSQRAIRLLSDEGDINSFDIVAAMQRASLRLDQEIIADQ